MAFNMDKTYCFEDKDGAMSLEFAQCLQNNMSLQRLWFVYDDDVSMDRDIVPSSVTSHMISRFLHVSPAGGKMVDALRESKSISLFRM